MLRKYKYTLVFAIMAAIEDLIWVTSGSLAAFVVGMLFAAIAIQFYLTARHD